MQPAKNDKQAEYIAGVSLARWVNIGVSTLLLVSLSLSAVLLLPLVPASRDVSSFQLKLRARSQHVDPEDHHLRVFIAEMPARFQTEPRNKMLGYGALGAVLEQPGNEIWDTQWHQLDYWFHMQLYTSPHRTYDAAAADIILVPVAPRIRAFNTTLRMFMKQAPEILPFLGRKPHLLVLNHPIHVYDHGAPGVLDMPSARHFTYVAMQAQAVEGHEDWHDRDISNIIITPNLMQMHWHRGHSALRSLHHSAFNASATKSRKRLLAAVTGKLRHYAMRYRLHGDCIARPKLCRYVNWTNDAAVGPTVDAMAASWYTFHGQADFALRAALYQALVAGSVPVLTNPEDLHHMPYTDMLNYAAFTVLMDGRDAGGFIDPKSPTGRANVIDLLQAQHNESSALLMLAEVHRVRRVMQFSLNPDHELLRFGEPMWQLQHGDDAFTFTMKAVMRRLCSQGRISAERCGVTARLRAAGGVPGKSEGAAQVRPLPA
jgi:hypothetical protein